MRVCSVCTSLLTVVWCSGTSKDTRGTSYVVYEDIYDAKAAADHLSGFNVANRYLIVLCACLNFLRTAFLYTKNLQFISQNQSVPLNKEKTKLPRARRFQSTCGLSAALRFNLVHGLLKLARAFARAS